MDRFTVNNMSVKELRKYANANPRMSPSVASLVATAMLAKQGCTFDGQEKGSHQSVSTIFVPMGGQVGYRRKH